jgi:endonuclease-3
MAARRESVSGRKERAERIRLRLRERFPDAHCELDFADPWQLAVAVVLSARCTDVKVNQVTPALFQRFPTPAALVKVNPVDIEPYVKSLGFFRNKAKSLVGLARALVEGHGGEVPRDREALEAMPGVGRKTAGVILAVAFGEPALPVDTHVSRVSQRLGLTQEEDPDRIEADLTALWPREHWVALHHGLIWHGRRICHARKPDCDACPLAEDCPHATAP